MTIWDSSTKWLIHKQSTRRLARILIIRGIHPRNRRKMTVIAKWLPKLSNQRNLRSLFVATKVKNLIEELLNLGNILNWTIYISINSRKMNRLRLLKRSSNMVQMKKVSTNPSSTTQKVCHILLRKTIRLEPNQRRQKIRLKIWRRASQKRPKPMNLS